MTTPLKPRLEHSPEEERVREAALDRTIEASFPASDPPSTLPNPYDEQALADAAIAPAAARGPHARVPRARGRSRGQCGAPTH
jgi:hypothetical protein